MFTKKRILQFCTAALIFLLADFWMYSTLSSDFRAYEAERNFNEIELFAKTVPDERTAQDFAQWVPTVKDIIPGARALYLAFDEQNFNFIAESGSETARALFQAYNSTPDFQKAMESVYYLEPMKLGSTYQADYSLDPDTISADTIRSQVYFVPVVDETGYQVSGAAMILVPTSTATGYSNLLKTLFIAAAVVFLGILLVLTFTRDPLTGFMVLGLFGIVLVFIAYPLIEAIRLSFMKDGVFSLQTWKESLSPTYLVALWGSLRLGVLTATISTLVGFIFAFLIERTRFKQKKLMTTMATMPVISPPFSLSLSIILLFGNNGLISKQLLHLNTSIYGLGGLTIVQVIGMFPIAFMTISGVLRQIDSTVEDASLDLSGTRWQTFKEITLPLSVPGILSAWLLVFTNSLADFANPLLLSGDYRVLSTEAYMLVTGRSNLGAGSALSFILLMPTLTAFLVQRNWVAKKSYVTVTGKPSTT
ncbi:MAG: iron ABC transporter permease, partial [Spirochaetaceae bacterium]|nr:iron ABC transporter permease [Spirochaetaceae bacterium]